MTEQNVRGRHARHAANDETQRIEPEQIRAMYDQAKRESVTSGGVHAGIDADETRRMQEQDKTAVYDFLYSEAEGPASEDARTRTQAYGAVSGGRGYADPYRYQPGSGRGGQHGQGAYAPADGPRACDSPQSGSSYVNDGPNARVVGFAKNPGREIDIDSELKGRRGRKARKAAQKASRNAASAPVQVASNGVQAATGKRKRSGCLSRLLRLILALAIICAIPLGIYCFLLDQALAIPESQRAEVESALQPAGFGKPYYMLLLGSDSREGQSSDTSERSDVIILLRIDPLGDKVTMVSIPRDTPCRLEDGSLVKINETYNRNGAAGVINAVSEVTGVPISHYAEVGFSDLENIVNTLGGVTVDVNTELSYADALTGDWVSIPVGTQTLDGQQAQIFARARHEYVYDQDANRQNNVRSLTEAIAKGIIDRPFYQIPGTTLDVARDVNTDMKSYNLLGTALPMVIHPGKTTVYSCTGPYAGDYNYEADGIWLCYEDPEGWSNLMAVVDKGEDPSQVTFSY